MIKFEEGGWFLPDGETHLQGWMLKMRQDCHGRLGYQLHKLEAALRISERRGLALDIGGHVGLWSWPLSHRFAGVVAFEPLAAHRACYEANLEGRGNWRLYGCALGAGDATVTVRTRTQGSSGDSGVEPAGGEGERVPQRRLDDFHLAGVDLVKLDCEGYEVFVLQGAVETLLRCKPVVIVEQKPETGGAARYGIEPTAAVTFLEHLGMKRRAVVQGDYILSF